MANLSQGALGRIQTGADVSEPIVQVPIILIFRVILGHLFPNPVQKTTLTSSVFDPNLVESASLSVYPFQSNVELIYAFSHNI
jgi:hypothetical protein